MNKPSARVGKVDVKVLLLGGLLALALGGVYFSYRITNAPTRPSPSGAPVSVVAPVGLSELDRLTVAVENRLKANEQRISADWASPVAAAAPKAKAAPVGREETVLRLRGVAQGGVQPLAFINEATVGLGESIMGFTVTEIRADGVTMVDGQGRKHVLPLYE